MLRQMEVFLIAALFVLLTAIILIINTWHRADEFKEYNRVTQQAVVNGAAIAINLHLQNRHRHVRLFLDEYKHLLVRLNQFPDDEKTASDVRARLQQRFPDFFTFTITDQEGTPILTDIESLVGNVCQLDLKNFAKSVYTHKKEVKNKVVIHPQPFQYHYDIMAPISMRGVAPRIFFSSFYLGEIANILKTHEIPGQRLFLVKQTDPSLIEVSRVGARDTLSRKMRLSKEELSQIRIRENIPNTAWQIVNLLDVS